MSKKLVGGDYLLDLSSIEIEQSEDGETYTNITDADVLEQLTNLKKYVPNPQMAKPVWIKLKNGENDELVVARGTFANVGTGEFEIVVAIDGYKLKIHIEFTQALNEDNNPIDDWYIAENDAKYLFTSDAQNIGAISELPVFENIVDAQGNKRFQDFEGVPHESIVNPYCKASLCGTHLLLVLAGQIPNGTTLPTNTTFASFTLPQWIYDKVKVVWGQNAIELKDVKFYGDDWSSQTGGMALIKVSNNRLFFNSSITATANRNFRVAFDLLIDNDAPESQGE